jgi:predicted phosphoadenosine phosphosulfate sulfurtransferase
MYCFLALLKFFFAINMLMRFGAVPLNLDSPCMYTTLHQFVSICVTFTGGKGAVTVSNTKTSQSRLSHNQQFCQFHLQYQIELPLYTETHHISHS